MTPVFLENFSNEDDVYNNFQITKRDEDKINILLAWYGYKSYSGYAFVLFEQNGKLYEITASHCSCYGLEGQWKPEETSVGALRYRMVNGSLGANDYGSSGGEFAGQLEEVLKQYENDTGDSILSLANEALGGWRN